MPKDLEHLPTELLEHVVSFLDVPPPSVSQPGQEPSLSDLFLSDTPLKNLSLVSKWWHRVASPLVLSYLRLSVVELQGLAVSSQEHIESQEEQRKAKLLERPHTWQSRQWTDPTTKRTFYASMKALSPEGVVLERYDKTELVLNYADLSDTDEHYVSMMANHVQDQLSQSLTSRVSAQTRALEDFLKMRAGGCKSLLVYSQTGYEKNFDTAGHHVNERAKIWGLTKRYINPERLVLIAPPELLARLAHCFTNVTDLWSFHIPFQRIELHQYPTSRRDSLLSSSASDQRKINYQDAEMESEGYGLLHSHYWSSFEYDEGSSLNIYGTYHYFEKRPPSIINLTSIQIGSLGSWLRSFTYTSVFPHHAHFIQVIQAIEGFKALMHLRLKIAPEPTSKLLTNDDMINIGNLNLRDCWTELERCYVSVCERLLSMVGERALPILERFESLDRKIEWVKERLEGMRFEMLPEWRGEIDGSWVPVEGRLGFRNWKEDKGETTVALQEVGSQESAAGVNVHADGYVPPMFGAYDP